MLVRLPPRRITQHAESLKECLFYILLQNGVIAKENTITEVCFNREEDNITQRVYDDLLIWLITTKRECSMLRKANKLNDEQLAMLLINIEVKQDDFDELHEKLILF